MRSTYSAAPPTAIAATTTPAPAARRVCGTRAAPPPRPRRRPRGRRRPAAAAGRTARMPDRPPRPRDPGAPARGCRRRPTTPGRETSTTRGARLDADGGGATARGGCHRRRAVGDQTAHRPQPAADRGGQLGLRRRDDRHPQVLRQRRREDRDARPAADGGHGDQVARREFRCAATCPAGRRRTRRAARGSPRRVRRG